MTGHRRYPSPQDGRVVAVTDRRPTPAYRVIRMCQPKSQYVPVWTQGGEDKGPCLSSRDTLAVTQCHRLRLLQDKRQSSAFLMEESPSPQGFICTTSQRAGALTGMKGKRRFPAIQEECREIWSIAWGVRRSVLRSVLLFRPRTNLGPVRSCS